MNNSPKIIEANSISKAFEEAVNFIDSWTQDSSTTCWFRGVSNNLYGLQPGAYWRTDYEELQSLITFAQEGVAFAPIGVMNCWETYYLAQHHSIPTRLLDWTESFAAALFFAFDGWDGTTTPCIWIMQPALLNKASIGWEGILAPENIEALKHWLPNDIAKANEKISDIDGSVYDNDWPIAIYPKKGNRRIVAQQGAFTVHGRQKESLEALHAKNGGDVEATFARLDLVELDREVAIRQLALLGVRRSAIYPDIDNFVREIREQYGW